MNFCEAINCQLRNDFFLGMSNCICKSKIRSPNRDWYCRYLDQSGRAREKDTLKGPTLATTVNIFPPEAERSEIQIIAALAKSRR